MRGKNTATSSWNDSAWQALIYVASTSTSSIDNNYPNMDSIRSSKKKSETPTEAVSSGVHDTQEVLYQQEPGVVCHHEVHAADSRKETGEKGGIEAIETTEIEIYCP